MIVLIFTLTLRTTQEQIHSAPRTHHNDLQPWTVRNLAGRGILIDYASYAKRHGVAAEAFSSHPITVADVEAIAKEQSVTLKAGDVLFIRTGFVATYKAADESRRQLATEGKWIGLGQSKETTKWLWERQFAAVVADNPAFEMFRKYLAYDAPPRAGRSESINLHAWAAPADHDWLLHPILLSGWGTPIGELFDLEGLSELCKKNKRWSFFFTSSPLNYTGAVASPPNCTAIM